jgi:translation elongation factor EF-G
LKEKNDGETKPSEEGNKTKKLNHYQRKRLKKLRKLDGVKQWFKINEKEIHNSITAGFEYTTTHGPLFGESILGACFVVDEIEVIDPSSKLFLAKHKREFEENYLKENDFAQPPHDEIVEEEKLSTDGDGSTKGQQLSVGSYSDTYGPMTGQIMSLASKLCKKGFLNAEPRVVEGMYK